MQQYVKSYVQSLLYFTESECQKLLVFKLKQSAVRRILNSIVPISNTNFIEQNSSSGITSQFHAVREPNCIPHKNNSH